MINKDFSVKNVLVVGGTSGINRGVAEKFGEAGAKVAVASRLQSKVDDTVNTLKQHTDAMGFICDVRNYEEVEAGINQVAEAWGSIDVLVSGAAGNFPAMANKMSANAFRSVVEIDLLGTYHVMRAAYPHLTKPGASVINISAPQAALAMVAQSHVCAAKAGVDMVTRTLALEWGPEGIRINSVIPGPISGTEGMKRLAPTAELQEACMKTVPLRRMGNTDDIAHACMMLSTPFASFITGAVLPVEGFWALGGRSAVGSAMEDFIPSLLPLG